MHTYKYMVDTPLGYCAWYTLVLILQHRNKVLSFSNKYYSDFTAGENWDSKIPSNLYMALHGHCTHVPGVAKTAVNETSMFLSHGAHIIIQGERWLKICKQIMKYLQRW